MVILLGLIFLLDSSTQDRTMKISFIFFRALFHLICIYKVQANFWNCLNRLEKRVLTSRDTCRTRRVPGGDLPVWALGARSAAGECPGVVSRCGLSGHVAHPESTQGWSPGVGSRGTWRTQRVPGGGLPVWALRARGALGECPGWSPGVG